MISSVILCITNNDNNNIKTIYFYYHKMEIIRDIYRLFSNFYHWYERQYAYPVVLNELRFPTNENIIKKLKQDIDVYSKSPWDSWSLEERKKLLEIYLIFCKKEPEIYSLIYSYHGCDSWEDIFRDYDIRELRDKARGVQIALDELYEREDEYSDESSNKSSEEK